MRYLLLALLLLASPAWADVYQYVVVRNIDDEKLVLMDLYGDVVVVEATLYCFEGFGFAEGDMVLSTENLSICAMATLISPSSRQTCDVWCP